MVSRDSQAIFPPRRQGWHMPAEWEPHEATWIGWPHNRHDWPGKFAAIPWVFGEVVRQLQIGEKVHILVNDMALRETGPTPAGQDRRRWPANSFLPHADRSCLAARYRADLRQVECRPARLHDLAFQCLGQVRRLAARLPGGRQDRRTLGLPAWQAAHRQARTWCWKAAASTSTGPDCC